MEFFTGRTIHAIEQDFHSRVLMLNIASMLESQAVNEILLERKSKSKYEIKSNFTQVVMKLKEFLVEIFIKKIYELSILKMLKFLNNCYDIERKNRSFVRKKSLKNSRKPLQYKAL